MSKPAVQDDRLYIAMPWFSQDEFEKVKTLPGSGLTGTFQEWEQLAQRIFGMMGKSGPRPVRVEITADGLQSFARTIGVNSFDASVRYQFAEVLEKQKLSAANDSLPVNFVQCPACARRLEPVALLPEGPMTLACGCGKQLRLEEVAEEGLRERLKRLFSRNDVSEISR